MLRSFSIRVGIALFLLQALFVAVILVQFARDARQQGSEEIQRWQQARLDALTKNAQQVLAGGKIAPLQRQLKGLLDSGEARQALLLDAHGVVLASGQSINTAGKFVVPRHNDADWRQLAVVTGGAQGGRLLVSFSSRRSEALTQRLWKQTGIAVGLGLAACLLLSIVVTSLLTHSLNKVIQVMKQVTQGNYRTRTGLDGDDDVSRMGNALDAMLAHIEAEKNRGSDHHRELELEVEERTRKLEIANEENRAFVDSISRDLRDPLRRLNSYAQALYEDYCEQLDEEGQQTLERIRYNGKEMTRLMDSLLLLTRVGHQELNRRNVNLSALLDDVIEKACEAHNGQTLHTKVAPDMLVYGDGVLLRRMLENLVDNAWKFTRHSPVPTLEVGVKMEKQPVYYFRDNGAGFDPDYSERLFAPFQRLHSTVKYPGLGIGLSTVQHIVHRHGGEIWATGEPEKGATFYFTLPDEDDAPAASEREAS